MTSPIVRSCAGHRNSSHKKDSRNLRVEHLEPRLVLSSSSLLQHLTASGSAITLGATADAYVNSAKPTTNYGRSNDLLVQNWSGACEAYLKYDLSSVRGTITNAYLNLRVLARSMNKSSLTLTIKLLTDTNDTWVEGTGGTNRKASGAITWSNSADGVGTAVSVTLTAAQLKKSPLVSINVTSLFSQTGIANTNKVASFAISASSSSRFVLDFASRDNRNASYRPTLSITSVPGETPTVAEQPSIISQTGTTATISVLGNDVDDAESNLIYSWSYTSNCSGVASFSTNGTNAAKSTTVSFSKAGTYYLTATVTDSTNLSIRTNSVTVTLAQTLTGISLSPTNVTLGKGASQQFVVTGIDQFKNNVSIAAGNVTWASTIGAFTGTTTNSTVTYVAPTTSTSGTVTATVGSFTATSSVVVADSNFLGLADASLALRTRDLFVDDGYISRADMLSIFYAISSEKDEKVDADDMKDLKTILRNSTYLCMPNYVTVLTGDVLNGNTANAYYQGESLGNLAIGDANSKLASLVNKWFYGEDLPNADNYQYVTMEGTLFTGAGPSHLDEVQGYLGDCYFLSAMGSIADSSKSAIYNMFVDNGDDTWTVRFYSNGTADYVTVNRELPTSGGYLVFQGCGSYYADASNTLWLCLLEKAYAQWNETGKTGQGTYSNDYFGIEGGWTGTVSAQALGYAASDYSMSTTNLQTLINALNNHKAVTIGTVDVPASGTGLVGNHAYNILSYNSGTARFTLYNPWGSSQPNQLTWTQLTRSCDGFSIIGTSGSVPITAVKSALLRPVALAAAASPLADDAAKPVLATTESRTYTLFAEVERAAQTSLPTRSVDASFEDRGAGILGRRTGLDSSFAWHERERLDSRFTLDRVEDSIFDNLDAATQLTQLLLSDEV